ncbi:hypothetical protein FCM35_KLT17194 [Carex littledalei]|uniref:Uncharacterized protein n=1 Tax=Carex littledalei TaxID=544730 RepID=A0A833RBI2_9POAL|nr:hypothetical protein FCM35_KLT17194 [Carex littledalei]
MSDQEEVLRLRADPDNADKPDEQLFLMASGRRTHGRVYGLGSTVNPSLLKSGNRRSKPLQYATVVTSQDNCELTFTAGQVKAIVEEHTRKNMFYIQKLFEITGNQVPELPQVATTSVPTNEGSNGNTEEDNTFLSNHVPPTNVTESENLYVDSFYGSVDFHSNLVL